ncbi:hypothetical protein HNQ80_003271 [Anaerosolibacter carboniphilus]|uniref:Uncharacterized protein n=1 Tax=Anaerosolibacter carboniphilus TaxID=1417629 RepID=A0A841L4B1_9FIRM|nr:hypothetical protein [Anaerosolibacter carboniphilus]
MDVIAVIVVFTIFAVGGMLLIRAGEKELEKKKKD